MILWGFSYYCLPLPHHTRLMINRLFVILALFAACFISVRGADRKFVLVIDAGHGGRDAGALGKYSKEKNTIAYKLPHQVYAKDKKARKNKITLGFNIFISIPFRYSLPLTAAFPDNSK